MNIEKQQPVNLDAIGPNPTWQKTGVIGKAKLSLEVTGS